MNKNCLEQFFNKYRMTELYLCYELQKSTAISCGLVCSNSW